MPESFFTFVVEQPARKQEKGIILFQRFDTIFIRIKMSKKRQIPHTFVIVFFIILFAAALTWVIPGSQYDRQIQNINGIERSIIKSDSFHYVENTPQTWQVFAAIFEGFVDKADIIIFILLVGGAFWIMNHSKAIDVGILSFLKHAKKLESHAAMRKLGVNNLIIISIMLVFSILGATYGMSEETIAFIIIFVPLAIKMGYDSIMGVSLCFVAAALGFAGALLNPFTIGIAQGIAQLPLFSGIEYRFICWVIINLVGFGYILWYARRIHRNPKKSPVYDDDAYWREHVASDTEKIEYHTPRSAWITFAVIQAVLVLFSVKYPETTLIFGNSPFTYYALPIFTLLFGITSILLLRKSVHYFILNLLMFTILFLIIGVLGYHWYVKEIATLFFSMGIASGLAMGYNLNTITKLFLEGAKDLLSAGLIVGLAGGIVAILQNGQIIDTLLFYVSNGLSNFGKYGTLSVMYLIQTGLNLVIPSGSAKAALTMPIMSQFSDLAGISRQAAVMAYQLGGGFTNIITPTSGVLMGVLGIAKIPFDKWFRWVLPLVLILVVLGFLLLIPCITMSLNGF